MLYARTYVSFACEGDEAISRHLLCTSESVKIEEKEFLKTFLNEEGKTRQEVYSA